MIQIQLVRVHLSILPLPRFFHSISDGSTASSIVGHSPPRYQCLMLSLLPQQMRQHLQHLFFSKACMNFFFPFLLQNWMQTLAAETAFSYLYFFNSSISFLASFYTYLICSFNFLYSFSYFSVNSFFFLALQNPLISISFSIFFFLTSRMPIYSWVYR